MYSSVPEGVSFIPQEEIKKPSDVVHNLAGMLAVALEIAQRDPMTGLLNKAAWMGVVEERVNRSIRSNQPMGILLMDMDAFKAVNDTLGHAKGDDLLQAFSRRLQDQFRRSTDTLTHERLVTPTLPNGGEQIGRLGGDEFGIVVGLVDPQEDIMEASGSHPTTEIIEKRAITPEERLEKMVSHAREMVDSFVAEQPDEIRALGFDVSIGRALLNPLHPVDFLTLVERADASMYANKPSNSRRLDS